MEGLRTLKWQTAPLLEVPSDMDARKLCFPSKSVSRYNFAMTHTFEEVRQFAQELPEDQRLLLANSLWEGTDTTDEADESEIAARWEPEILRRVEEIKSGTAITYSLAEVEADLRAATGR